ncbi:MAG: hypothetical protein CO160_01490, partial [Candidatus Portnoybacteria bacterium CG_4_9_14_3_um_filter_43_11]
ELPAGIESNFSKLSQKNEEIKIGLKKNAPSVALGLSKFPSSAGKVVSDAFENKEKIDNFFKNSFKTAFSRIKFLAPKFGQWVQKKTTRSAYLMTKVLPDLAFSLAVNLPRYSFDILSDTVGRFTDILESGFDIIHIGSRAIGDGFSGTLNNLANIFDIIPKINENLSSFTQEAESKLGDAYIKIAQFFLPGYSIEQLTGLEGRLVVKTTIKDQPAQPAQPSAPKETTTREITQVKQVTQEKTTEVTRIIETVESSDLSGINQNINLLSQRLTDLSTQIASKIDYTVPSYAPVYIPSSGLQVAGNALLTTLNVSGSGAIGGSLSVRQNFSVGNTQDNITPTMTVNADSTFNNPATFNGGITASGVSVTGGLSVGGDTTLTGNVSIAGDITSSGGLTVSATSTLATSTIAQLTITNDLLVSGNATTTQSQAFLSTLSQTASSTNPIFKINASSTDAHLDFKLTGSGPLLKITDNQDSYKFYIDNSGLVGIGTTS